MVGQCIALELFWFTSPPRRRETNFVSLCRLHSCMIGRPLIPQIVGFGNEIFGFESQDGDGKRILLHVEDAAI